MCLSASAAIAGMTTSPQLRESPETAKFQVWGASLGSAARAIGKELKARARVRASLCLCIRIVLRKTVFGFVGFRLQGKVFQKCRNSSAPANDWSLPRD